MEWYLKVLKNCINFSGRARRKEYWMFVLFNVLIGFGLGIVDGIMGWKNGWGMGRLGGLYDLFVLLPSIALGARRLHDIGRSGWWQLIALIPILGWIVLIVWAASEGERGANAYGPDPKAGDGDGVPAMA